MMMRVHRRQFIQASAATLACGGLASAAPEQPDAGRKKGCCFVATPDRPWLERTKALNARWLYTWGADPPEGLPDGVEFCPMIWGGSTEEKLAGWIDKLRPHVESGRVRQLMGFNEPDQPSQSNMTVDEAVALWPVLMELGVPLVSPGCVHPDRRWMYQFMEQALRRNLRVDFIAAHSYGGPDAEALLQRMEKVSRVFGRPVWLTEFAVGDWRARSVDQNRHSPQRVAAFMREVLPALDEAAFIGRYAWFSAEPKNKALGTSALFDERGGLTPLGEVYAEAS